MFLSNFPDEKINELPLKFFNGTIYVIHHENDFETIKQLLSKKTILGFDTETKPSFKKGVKNNVALIQLADSESAFLFRINKIGIPDFLIDIFENDKIIKIGVAIRDDIKGLQKIKNFQPKSFIDLQNFVKNYNINDNSLRKLTANVLNFRISKKIRTSDWEKNYLDEKQILYAATDAWVCYEIYKKLIQIDFNDNETKHELR